MVTGVLPPAKWFGSDRGADLLAGPMRTSQWMNGIDVMRHLMNPNDLHVLLRKVPSKRNPIQIAVCFNISEVRRKISLS